MLELEDLKPGLSLIGLEPEVVTTVAAVVRIAEGASEALGVRVFDILGEVFEETSLKDLLIQAIRYGDQPEVRARNTRKLDHAFDYDHLDSLVRRNALAQETMSAERLGLLRERRGESPPDPVAHAFASDPAARARIERLAIRRPFDREPEWGVSSINYNLAALLKKAEGHRRA